MIRFTILENAVGHLTEEKTMGKKRQRKKVVSKGIVGGPRVVAEKTSESKMLNKVAAWTASKPVMLTVANPNKEERNKPFIRVKADHYWGPFDRRKFKQSTETA